MLITTSILSFTRAISVKKQLVDITDRNKTISTPKTICTEQKINRQGSFQACGSGPQQHNQGGQ